MTQKIKELEKQIAEKNKVLNSLSSNAKEDREKIYRAKRDLDRLLYIYYKSFKCKCGSTLSCWSVF